MARAKKTQDEIVKEAIKEQEINQTYYFRINYKSDRFFKAWVPYILNQEEQEKYKKFLFPKNTSFEWCKKC